MNPELQRQHEAYKARHARFYATRSPRLESLPCPVREQMFVWRPHFSPWERILRAVSDHTGISREEMAGPRHLGPIVNARQIAMFLLREDVKLSYPRIARRLGDRDHTTIMHGHQKMKRLLAVDEKLSALVATIRAEYSHALEANQ